MHNDKKDERVLERTWMNEGRREKSKQKRKQTKIIIKKDKVSEYIQR